MPLPVSDGDGVQPAKAGGEVSDAGKKREESQVEGKRMGKGVSLCDLHKAVQKHVCGRTKSGQSWVRAKSPRVGDSRTI